MGLSTCILLDPRLARRWRAIEGRVLEQLAPALVVPVADAQTAEAAAWEAAFEGCERLITVGPPALAHGLVNAVMRLAESHRRRLRVGGLTLGRPGPMERTLRWPAGFTRQLDVLAAAHTLPVDVGRCESLGEDSRPATRHFLHGAWIAAGAPGPVSGAGKIVHAARASRHAQLVALLLDGQCVYEGPWGIGAVMQCSHYPALGRVAPAADPMDGAFDVAWIPGGVLPLLRRLPALWLDGLRPGQAPFGWLPAPNRAQARQVRALLLEGAEPPAPVSVEVDGAPVGRLPAAFTLIPKALPVIVEAVPIRLAEKQRAVLADLRGTALAGNWRRSAV